MPNERLQQLVLYNMKDQGIVDDEYTLSQFTPTSFKDDLGKMTQLVWQPGDDKSDDYNNLDAWNGGNGAIGQPNPNPGNYSLKGLEYCKNLTDLELSQSNFDFGHHLFRNDIVDVSPLSGLVKLQKIDLSRERITDITPISKLPNVTYLNINFNSISDLSSLDAKQYTDGFWYEGQSYVLPFKNLPSDSYSWVTPFEGKLPKGVNYLPTEVYSAARQGVVLNYAPEDNPAGPNFPHTYLEIFYGGAVPTISGGSLLFNDLAPQAEATTDNPWNNQMKVVKNTYKNYMIAYYRQGQNTNPTFTAYIPYETNVAESKYEIQPVDKNGNNINGYTPTSFSGTEGDKVSVPTISGYTVNDNKVVDGQITLPAGDSSQTTIIKVIYDKNTVPYTIHPVNKDGNSLGHDVSGEDAAGKAVDIPDIPGYVVNDSKVVNNAGHNQVIIPDSGGNINVIYAKTFANETTLNVNYLDNDNNQLLQQKLIHGSVNDPYTVTDDYYPDTLTINGQLYILVRGKMPANLSGTLVANTAPVILYYQKQVTPPNPNPGPGPEPNPTPVNPTPMPSTPTVTTQPSTPGIAKKGEAVYALKKIYMYSNKDFKKSERVANYAKKPRINRPMFVVTDYATSKAGNLRHVVRDVNHHSKTAGKKGYITADYSFVRPVYYHSSHKTLTVINPRGVNEYTNKDLTGKVKNFKQGMQLKVKGFVKHNLTTRYLLSNGHYITGNRKLVIAGSQKQPKQIKVKKAIYRYNNANLSKRDKHIKKGTILKVKKWEYSQPYSTTTFGAKRYAVAGGYVTANSKYVKVIK